MCVCVMQCSLHNVIRQTQSHNPHTHTLTHTLDAVEVEHALGVGQDEGVEGQDLEHLQRGHQRAATLLDHVTDWEGQNHQ